MKLNTLLVVPALLGALLLSACGEKAADATDAATGAATEAVGAATEAAEATTEAAGDAAAAVAEAAPAATGGGYEPTAEERIPGETRPVDAAPTAEAPAAPAN